MRALIILLIISTPFFSIGQKHCKCDADDIAGWKYREKGRNIKVLYGQQKFQHPVTTFYRGQGSWYNQFDKQSENLSSLRKMLTYAHYIGGKFNHVYEDIYTQALNTDHLYYNFKEDHKEYASANTAKAAAFVLMAGFDADGKALNDISHPNLESDLKARAINVIKRLDNKNGSNNDDLYFSGWDPGVIDGKGYIDNHFWVEKNLLTLLIAYDYLKAVYPDDADVKTCGDLLQCYTRHIYLAGTQLFGNYSRIDNHALMTAGVVGLASVVLADLGANRYQDSWHPDRWANASNWKILKTLYHRETERGDTNGFGEGTHYAKHSLEMLMPYFLAYTNARPSVPGNEKYDAEGLWQVKAASLSGLWYISLPATIATRVWEKETLEETLWDDKNFEHVISWYCNMLLPDGTYPTIDDSYTKQRFDGIFSFRTKSAQAAQWLPQYHTLVHSNINTEFVDFRCEIAATIAEGYLTDVPDIFTKEAVSLPSGDIFFKPRIRNDQTDPMAQTVYFHLNAENEVNGTNFFGLDLYERGHEHRDAMGFTIYADGSYLAFDPAYVGDRKDNTDYRFADAHNTWTIDRPNYLRENEGPCDGKVIVTDNFDKGGKEVNLRGYFLKNGSKIFFNRTVTQFASGYNVEDETIGVGFKILDEFETNNKLESNTFTSRLNGNAMDGKFSLTFDQDADSTFVGRGRATWHDCSLTSNQLTSVFAVRIDPSQTINGVVQVDSSIAEHSKGGSNGVNPHKRLNMVFTNSKSIKVTNILNINSCTNSFDTIYPSSMWVGGGLVDGTIFHADNSYQSNFSNPQNEGMVIGNIFVDNDDTLYADVDELYTSFNFVSGSPCGKINNPFRYIKFKSGTYVRLNDTAYVESNNTLENFSYKVSQQKFNYEGKFTTLSANDTICFFIPEFPDPALSLMTETNGLAYSFDTITQKMTLSIPTAGTYKFNFEPDNPCILSCFFPRDSIIDTFYFNTGSQERLGHEMEILPDSGWLDITQGSKMLICSKAVLRNKDSLSLASGLALGEKTIGYGQSYLTNEDEIYREQFGVGSGASETSGSTRSMIIVKHDGALILKDSSHTHVGCGGTILVRSGGTLKIENGATVTIGDECGGFGEIIVEDSAFLCIEDSAYIEFFNGKLDTADKHIFFISKNPKNPAIVGVGDSSNAAPSNDCIDFCDLKDSFPTHGIANHTRGWFNVGVPEAWFYADSVICDGRDLWINAIPTLNETRYRFSVCEYDKIAQTCIGSPTNFPSNDLDDYYGGRIEKVNLTDTASLLRNKIYKVTLKVLNDCDEESSFSRVVEIPTELTANIEGDTVLCGGSGVVKVNGLNSVGVFDSLSWEIWEHIPFPEYDSTGYYNHADSIVTKVDTIWADSVTIDTIHTFSFPFYFTDTLESDSFHNGPYYQTYFDTTIVSSTADTFQVDSMVYEPGKKYLVHLTLYNNCGISRDTLIVRMRNGPDVDAGPDRYIAAAHSSVSNTDPELDAVVTGHTGTPTWSPTSNLSPSTSLNAVANPSSTTTYTLSATDANGCTNTDDVTVFVNTFANAGADTIICYDDSAKVGIPLFAGDYDFNWTPGTWVSDSTLGEPYAYPDPNGSPRTIKVKVTNNMSVVEWDDIVIYSDSTIDPTFNQMGGAPYDVLFTISETQVVNENFTWVWGDGWSNGTGNNPGHTYPPAPSSSYYTCVSYVNACGTVEWCDTVKFDALGNHIPTPPSPNSSKVEAAIDEYSFNVAPNPFQKQTSITYQLGGSFKDAQIEIFGIDGKRIQKMPIQAKQGRVNLNMENYESGMYYAKLVVDGSVQQVKKLILNH